MTTSITTYTKEKIDELLAAAIGDGTWENPLILGVYHLWVDETGKLRIKNSAPSSAIDGTVVGTQA